MTLEEALALWRIHRTAELAELVDAVAAKLPAQKVPRGGIQLAWQELKKNDHAKLGALLPLLTRSVPVQERVKPWRDNASRTRMSAWCTRLSRLARFAPDPRIAAALVAVLREPPFEMGDPFTGQWLYQPALDILAATADERGLAELRDLVARPSAKTKNLREFFAAQLPPVIAAIEAFTRTPGPDVSAAFAAVGGTPRERMQAAPISRADEAALIDAVLGDPSADGPRAILGDYWQEHNHAQGELVALQLLATRTTAQDARIKQLVRDDRWLGDDLRRVTMNRRYVRGLLDAFELQHGSVTDSGGWRRAAADPALATVRSIARGASTEAAYIAFATSPAVRSLEVVQVTAVGLARLAASGPRSIEHLAFSTRPTPVTLATIATFPLLRRLTIVTKVDQLASIAHTLAAWPERKQLDEICAGLGYVRGVREAAAWLRERERFAIACVAIDINYHDPARIALYRDRRLVVRGNALELAQIAGQLGRMKRVELATDSRDLQQRFAKARPSELVVTRY